MAMDVTNQWPTCQGCKQPMRWAETHFMSEEQDTDDETEIDGAAQ